MNDRRRATRSRGACSWSKSRAVRDYYSPPPPTIWRYTRRWPSRCLWGRLSGCSVAPPYGGVWCDPWPFGRTTENICCVRELRHWGFKRKKKGLWCLFPVRETIWPCTFNWMQCLNIFGGTYLWLVTVHAVATIVVAIVVSPHSFSINVCVLLVMFLEQLPHLLESQRKHFATTTCCHPNDSFSTLKLIHTVSVSESIVWFLICLVFYENNRSREFQFCTLFLSCCWTWFLFDAQDYFYFALFLFISGSFPPSNNRPGFS